MNPAIKVQPITQLYLQAIINTTPRFSIELMPIASQSYNDASKQFFSLVLSVEYTSENLCQSVQDEPVSFMRLNQACVVAVNQQAYAAWINNDDFSVNPEFTYIDTQHSCSVKVSEDIKAYLTQSGMTDNDLDGIELKKLTNTALGSLGFKIKKDFQLVKLMANRTLS